MHAIASARDGRGIVPERLLFDKNRAEDCCKYMCLRNVPSDGALSAHDAAFYFPSGCSRSNKCNNCRIPIK